MPALYIATGREAGDELSSTYEGRHITLEESYLTHPYHAADNLVDKGDPVICGDIVGVALLSAAAATDLISIDTEGIWYLNVLGVLSDQTSDGIAHAGVVGDRVYARKVPSTNTWLLTLETDSYNFIPFGYLMGDVSASVTTPTVVAVKVHGTPNMLDKIWEGSSSTVPAKLDPSGTNRQTNWIKGEFAPSAIMTAGTQIQGIQISMRDGGLVNTGGELTAAEFKVTSNFLTSDLDRMTALKLGVTNTLSASFLTGVYAISIAMGGAGNAPAKRFAFEVKGDGTAGTQEGWFETEIARGIGLKADATSINVNRAFEIPIYVDGTRYAIPVIAWT